MSRTYQSSLSSSVQCLQPSMQSKSIHPKIAGLQLPFPTLCLALYPPFMWCLQKIGSLSFDVNVSGYTIHKFPAILLCFFSCCIAVNIVRCTRKYHLPDQDDATTKKWNPDHLTSCFYCLLSPTSVIPLVINEFSPSSLDNHPAFWLAISITQGYVHILLFHLFFLRESIDRAVFHQVYQTEVDHRDAMDSARRQAERHVFERAGLYSNGAWNADPRQFRGAGAPSRQRPPPAGAL